MRAIYVLSIFRGRIEMSILPERFVSTSAPKNFGGEMNIYYLSEEEYNWLMKKLEEEPKELPRLRALLTQKTVFDAKE
jgi:PHD/YefM family antitoxin component YafN of YafNO toxin-antitoxin module